MTTDQLSQKHHLTPVICCILDYFSLKSALFGNPGDTILFELSLKIVIYTKKEWTQT